MPSVDTHTLRLTLLITLLLCCVPPDASPVRGDEEASRSVDQPDRDELTRRHDELARRTKRHWQQGEDAQAYAGLQELLQLYQQIYPLADFPAGHPHMILCYRDLCRLSEQLGDIDAMLHFGQDGLEMCQQLFTLEEFPHGHVETACMLANLAHALMLQGRPVTAREHLLKSIEMSESLWGHGLDGLSRDTVAGLHLSIAATYAQQGDDLQSLRHTTLAVKGSQELGDAVKYLDQVRLSAQCLLEHGKALISVGDYQSATDTMQQAYDLSLRLFLAEHSPASHLALIDAHVEMGVLYRLKSDVAQAKWHLRRAQKEIEMGTHKSSHLWKRASRVFDELGWLTLFDREPIFSFLADRNAGSTAEVPNSMSRNQQVDRIHAIISAGAMSQLKGDYRTAEDAFCAASGIARTFSETCTSGQLHPVVVWAELHTGRFFKNAGKYREAHKCFSTSMSAAELLFPPSLYPSGHPFLAIVMHYSATQLWLLGETESAAALYREAMLMSERLFPVEDYPRGHRQLMAAYSAWGNVLEREGDYPGATDYFAKAHQIALAQFPEAEYPNGHDELALVWRDLGRLERAQGRYASALEYFHQALASYQCRYAQAYPEGHLLVALALSELGRTHCRAGDFAQAEQYHQRSLAMRRRLFPQIDYPQGHPSLATALRDLGRTFLASERGDEAFVLFAESAQMEQAVADSFVGGGSEALLLNLAARKFQSLDCLLDAWERSDRPADEAYASVWRRRGFVPRLIAQRHRALRQMNGVGTVADRDAYLGVRRELSRALLVSAMSDVENNATHVEMVRRLNVRKEQLETRLSRQLLPFTDKVGVTQHEPHQLAELLPQDALLVDFVIHAKDPGPSGANGQGRVEVAHLLAFILAHGQPIVCVPLGDAGPVEELARQWRTAVLNGQENDYGDKLRQMVWDPVSQWFPSGTQSVYIAPDGALATIPWNALPLPDQSRLLIEQYAIALVPHGPFLLETLGDSTDNGEESGRILAVGDLDFGAHATHVDSRPFGLKQAIWRPLQGSQNELENLAVVAGARECVQLTGSDATTAAVIEQLPTCRWAHFATHGFFVDDELQHSLQLATDLDDGRELERNRSRTSVLRRSPFVRSGLALSGANELGKLDETGVPLEVTGILTAESIAAVDCSGLELVVLSACESGRGDVVHGDGVFGIQTAFHVAGARNIIASLWKIDDQATADLMSIFYRQLWTDGRTPLVALRGAQLEMLRRSRAGGEQLRGPVLATTVRLPKNAANSDASPVRDLRYWAGFMLSGPGF